ncbi:unnamed protein product [Cylicocyclus nassatus]|uniref:Uncharacterized protein n=1 Tax=Cylicocyclus nassatus TaxID=53992 RepID=A0AA36GWX6_CYLNA|nr:unnamed protein product [Cylicocyclus nassatus]
MKLIKALFITVLLACVEGATRGGRSESLRTRQRGCVTSCSGVCSNFGWFPDLVKGLEKSRQSRTNAVEAAKAAEALQSALDKVNAEKEDDEDPMEEDGEETEDRGEESVGVASTR